MHELAAASSTYGGIADAAIRAWVSSRLEAAAVIDAPFRHLIVHDIFPPPFFAALKAAWPSADVFKTDKSGRKYDLVPMSDAAVDPRAAGYAALPEESRRLWDYFLTLNRQVVGPRLRDMFRVDVDARLARLRDAAARGLVSYSMARAADGTPVANAGRFMMRGAGSELRPHVDAAPYVVTVLHYFPERPEQADGTIFYKAAAPIDFDRCARSGSTEYFDETGIACVEVMRVPYEDNVLVAFPNTLDAAHGAASPAVGLRRIFQYHLSLKGDREKV
jgi:hypothetical protein